MSRQESTAEVRDWLLAVRRSARKAAALRRGSHTAAVKAHADRAFADVEDAEEALARLAPLIGVEASAIIRDYYLRGMEWWEVAQLHGISVRTCRRKRDRAIEAVVMVSETGLGA